MRSAALAVCVWLAATSASAGIPDDVARYLRGPAGFAAADMAELEAGRAIARTVADDKGEVLTIGAVTIRTTKEHVQLYFDEFVRYEDGAAVLRVGRFSDPPRLDDVARLELDEADVEALRRCRPRACDVKVGAAIGELNAAVDWKAPDVRSRVTAFVRQRLVDYVAAYRERGDAALVTYVDRPTPLSLAAQWKGLLAASPQLLGYAPELQRYLEEYPRAPVEGTHDFVQWSKVNLGTGEPIVAVTHVVGYRDPARPDRLSMALKQIYASRYHEGAFSFATIVGGASADGPPSTCVVFASRTLTSLVRGGLGKMKRKLAESAILKQTRTTLEEMRDGLERAAGSR